MKRFKLSRKEKLLFATPLLVLSMLAWPLGKIDSLDRTLGALAGPEAIDCGLVSRPFLASQNAFLGVLDDPCATSAFQTGKPFRARLNDTDPHTSYHTKAEAIVRTPEGRVYFLSYVRPTWRSKALLTQQELYNAQVYTRMYADREQDNHEGISSDHAEHLVAKATEVWW